MGEHTVKHYVKPVWALKALYKYISADHSLGCNYNLVCTVSQHTVSSDCLLSKHEIIKAWYPLTAAALSVHYSDSPHCEPPLVEEPAPDTVSVSHNSEDGE